MLAFLGLAQSLQLAPHFAHGLLQFLHVLGHLLQAVFELGRALISKLEYQVGAFRTAPLRNVALTAPYMHDGSMQTLWDVVAHYNEGGTKNTWQDPQIRPLGLTEQQVDQVVAFLFTLTDRRFAAQNRRVYAEERLRAKVVVR